MFSSMIAIGFGLFLLTGAYFGSKAGSKISLWMGLVSGFLVFVAAGISQSQYQTGWMILKGVSVLLSCVFLARLLKTKKFMPSGMLLAITVLFFIFSLSR